jgi:Fe-S-cluster containining protein
MVKYQDSLDKIYDYIQKLKFDIIISDLFFRIFTCPPKCGACCPKFSLDYFEGERWKNFKRFYPEKIQDFKLRRFKGVKVFSNLQEENKSHFCMYLDKNARCKIHKANPFSCSFELIKLVKRQNKVYLIKKVFSRGWNMKKINNKKGTLCKMIYFYNKHILSFDLKLLKELNYICNLFKEKTNLSLVIKELKNKYILYKGEDKWWIY